MTGLPKSLFALGFCVLSGGAALAQSMPDPSAIDAQLEIQMSSNLGFLEYCKANGLADDAAIAGQRKIIDQLPRRTASPADVQAAIENGKLGKMTLAGNVVDMAEFEKTNPGTIAPLCQQVVDGVKSMGM